MRYALALLFALTACAAEPVLLPDASTPDAGPCGGACGAGTVCVGGACVVVDAGRADAGALDVGAVDSGSPVDVGEDRPAPVDVGTDSGAADTGDADAGADASPALDDGCADLTTASNCGVCGRSCTAAEQCGAVPGGHMCVPRCPALRPDWCSTARSSTNTAVYGICTDLATDNANCGRCYGERCVNGVRHCERGVCVRN